VGFTIREMLVEADEASEPEDELSVSQAWVEVADQESVLDAGPVFWITML
jgi:hypothetical protein